MAVAFPFAADDREVEEALKWTRTYDVMDKLGEGQFGEVFKVLHKATDKVYAMKRIEFSYEEEGIPSAALREVSLLKGCIDPNVIRLHEVYSLSCRLLLIFDLLDMDLRAYLKANGAIGEDAGELGLRSAVRQCLRGVDFCHGHRILHRDLKPQNVLVDVRGQTLKLADFGLARTFSVPLRPYTHEVVTLWYRAPEILLGQAKYATPMDVWSLGCILAEMATARPLFPGDSEIGTLFKVFRLLGTPDDEIWPGVSALRDFSSKFPRWPNTQLVELRLASPVALGENGLELLRGLLLFNPVARISARRALQHAFLDPASLSAVQQAFASSPHARANQPASKASRTVLNLVYREVSKQMAVREAPQRIRVAI